MHPDRQCTSISSSANGNRQHESVGSCVHPYQLYMSMNSGGTSGASMRVVTPACTEPVLVEKLSPAGRSVC